MDITEQEWIATLRARRRQTRRQIKRELPITESPPENDFRFTELKSIRTILRLYNQEAED